MFQTREIEKRYLAEVHGILGQPGDILTCDAPLDGKASRSMVTVLEVFAERSTSRVEIFLESGRYHQIRRHLSGIGHPLVGDRRYGNRRQTADLRLTAFSLAFICPFTGKKRHYFLNQDLSGGRS
jgi:tRNA pseudouridine32 synthase/23S rRNA pseudouridine746 synthase